LLKKGSLTFAEKEHIGGRERGAHACKMGEGRRKQLKKPLPGGKQITRPVRL